MWALQIPDIENPVTDFSYLDPLYVFESPKPLVETLLKSLWTTLTATLATCFETYVSIIWKLIPPQFHFVQYSQAHQLDGGDIIHGQELIPLQTDSQDMFCEGKHNSQGFWLILIYCCLCIQSSISLLLTNLLINHTKHLNLNFKISLAKYFAFLLLTFHHLLIMGLRNNLYVVINEIKVLYHGTNLYRFYQATGPNVVIDFNV